MVTYYIYMDNVETDMIMVTEDTSAMSSLGNWLDDNGYENQYEMIRTNDDGNHYAVGNFGYIEMKEESSSEIKESIINHFETLLKNNSQPFKTEHIEDFKKEIERCSSDYDTVQKVYEWENDALGLRSRGETSLSHLYQSMFQEFSQFLP